MRFQQTFTVAAPAEEVWRTLVDVERVAPCLPGAEITGADGDTYRGAFTVKLGPTTIAYGGTLRMEERDEAARRAVMAARGSDRRGQGGATATIASTVREEGDRTAVDVTTDLALTGRLARFGRPGMIEDVSRRLLDDFAACLEAKLAPAAAPAEAAPAAPAAAGTGAPAPAADAPAGTAGEAAGGPGAGGPAGAADAGAGAPTGEVPSGGPARRPLDVGLLGARALVDRLRRWWKALGRRLRGRRSAS